jgi:hypothetical protein
MAQSKQSQGGKARAKALSAEERSRIAQRAASVRWGRGTPEAICEGLLKIGGNEIHSAVLPGEVRVVTQSTFLQSIGRSRSPKAGTGVLTATEELPTFLSAAPLQPFIPQEVREASGPEFWIDQAGRKQAGYRADLLPMVCEVYLKYRDSCSATRVSLPRNYEHIVRACDILMRGLAQVGIIALVDEATGYQRIRARHALEEILEKFIAKELVKWTKQFPDDYYIELFRLKGWDLDAMTQRPQVVGRYTNDLIYERLAPGVLEELRTKNPPTGSGRRKHKHHQWLTEDVGHPSLREHLAKVVTIMQLAPTWEEFKLNLDRLLPRINATREMF